MILQQKIFRAKKKNFFDQKFIHPNCFRGNDFATKKIQAKKFFDKKKLSNNVFIQTVSEEMILQKQFSTKINF